MDPRDFDKLLEELPPELRDSVDYRKKTKICPVCKEEFESSSGKRIFCKPVCRMRWHRVKRLVEKHRESKPG